MRHPAHPGNRQLLLPSHGKQISSVRWSAPVVCLLQKTFTSASTAFMASSPAALWRRNQQKQLSYVGSVKTVGNGPHARRLWVRALHIQAALWSPSMNEKDAIPEAMREQRDWEEPPPARWPGLGSGQPVARRSKASPIVQVKSQPARIQQYSNCPSLSKQAAFAIPPPRRHHVSAPCHNTNSHSDVPSPLSLKTLCFEPHAQHVNGQKTIEQTDFHRYAHRYAAKISAENKWEESSMWTVSSKEEPK